MIDRFLVLLAATVGLAALLTLFAGCDAPPDEFAADSSALSIPAVTPPPDVSGWWIMTVNNVVYEASTIALENGQVVGGVCAFDCDGGAVCAPINGTMQGPFFTGTVQDFKDGEYVNHRLDAYVGGNRATVIIDDTTQVIACRTSGWHTPALPGCSGRRFFQ